MKLSKLMKNIWSKFENLFMTDHKCMSCGREIKDKTEFQICNDCKNKINVINGNLCKICGDEICGTENIKICDRCKNSNYAFMSNRSLCYYDTVPAKIIKKLKYGKRKYYAKHIAEMMQSLVTCFDNIDVITFVPVSSKRRKERGFNQAEEIAKELGLISNISVVDALEKLYDGKTQAGLSQKERRENLKGTIKLKNEIKQEIKGKNVLIVDDVFTTGSTLHECASVLQKAEPKKIFTCTFAKTKFNMPKN